MKVLMGNDRLHIKEVFIGSRRLIGKYKLAVENIQPFVFHGTHIEEVHRDYHVNVEVILEAKNFFIPTHGTF